MLIESLQNEKIKRLTRLLSKNQERKKAGVFIVEGLQENRRALEFGNQAEEFYICESIFAGKLPEAKIYFVSEKLYEKMAYRGTTEGIIGIYKLEQKNLKDFNPEKDAAVIILESVEKPGNLGAILRSCEAFGINALIVTDPKTDFYNPNVIRSSVGCLFGMNIFQASNTETLEFLQRKNFNIFTTFMSENAQNIQKLNLKGRSAILFGTEHSGLSDFWKDKGQNMVIPMAGTIDSLNLSNAAAIACYEILRQRLET
ncbi:TrmH family RNA methyltransferase [Chryseobacterium sp. SC28]|uniref:TrmH family RNA methyltransferase n=1 Tax=Chryseobacterium sp. SC28 TaxID=2268028 RepID=UPI000F64B224|nr:TrmH family RNA methyltransferase [Chryseobacterium sp. SC28]RRQ46886.1 RNA methyltransferase [Chryseobacterium sp. SC28]